MASFWHTQPRRPPMPLVEDEWESLSREIGGLSLIGEKPGYEGACERGTVDQYPVLLAVEPPPRSESSNPSLTSASSRDTPGPATPPPANPVVDNPKSSNGNQDFPPVGGSKSERPSPGKPQPEGTVGKPSRSRKRPTVAELIEQKLRQRREQKAAGQTSGQTPETLSRDRSDVAPQPSVTDPESRPSSVKSPSDGELPELKSSLSGSSKLFSYGGLTDDAGGECYSDGMPISRGSKLRSSTSPDESSGSRIRKRGRRAVTFAEDTKPADRSPRSSQSRLHRQQAPPKQPAIPEGLLLRPCQRSIPVAGFQDWYTIKGLTHLNICPGCMNQIGNSRFRDLFIPSLRHPAEVPIRCSLSEPWTRLAWIQTIKKGYNHLDMLYEITKPPSGTSPCYGRRSVIRTWYRIIDPETGENVSKFAACGACVRNIRILMPPIEHIFRRQPGKTERVCDLSTESPRFVQYLDLLDAAANECQRNGRPTTPDYSRFVDYVRRKCRLRDCRRDRLILSTWHYIPELPEFSICEDCYDDVVRPLAAAHKPIARMVSRSARLLPGSAPNRCREASCQLYSPRMRARFREAVLNDDFRMLKTVALRRYEAENRWRERKLQLLREGNMGYPRDVDLRLNDEEWKRYE
ncbi:hypothetical protein VTN49DRAFT_7739 [Thermomyces lanuginosus]|uniref:uncharacterized protein n=1 Tax=Thermomyces lanuginosus TaxID=5541 RepID=UPI003742A1BA